MFGHLKHVNVLLQAFKTLQRDVDLLQRETEAACLSLHCCIAFSATRAGTSFSTSSPCRSPSTCGAMMRQPQPSLRIRRPRPPHAAQQGTMQATC